MKIMQLEKINEARIEKKESISSYFLTLQQATNSISSVVLRNLAFLKRPAKKQHVLVIARCSHLDFYSIRKTLWNSSTPNIITKKKVLFSTPLYTPIETMLGWYPSKNRQWLHQKCRLKTLHSHQDLTLHQDGLVLLSKSLCLYLVIPNYARQTVQLVSTLNLNVFYLLLSQYKKKRILSIIQWIFVFFFLGNFGC
jgi:Na+/H+ antiporter NhaD/arsenite permease-like protein